jgi:hypothetical protein
MNKPITFRHQYYKLSQPQFTTIRGKVQFFKLKIGDKIPIETPNEDFTAEIVHLALSKMENLSLPFLKLDAEYPGFEIKSKQDFIDLLNSFRAPAWTQVNFESELTVITLKKL